MGLSMGQLISGGDYDRKFTVYKIQLRPTNEAGSYQHTTGADVSMVSRIRYRIFTVKLILVDPAFLQSMRALMAS